MPHYSTYITEPHPTVEASTWTHAGRGGAGNFFKAPKAVTPADGVPTPITPTVSHRTTSSSAAAAKFHSGRGGAGNAHSSIERPVMSFEDEYLRKERTDSASRPAFTGRGGAGNFKSASSTTFANKQSTRKGSDASTASNASTKSGSSTRSGFLGRLSASLSNKH